jgi:hypothetical protein
LTIYTIKQIIGIHAILSNDSKVRLDELQIVKDIDIDENNIVEQVDKGAKI